MKKIFILNKTIEVGRGGLTRVILERATHFNELGYDSELLTIDYNPRYRKDIQVELRSNGRLGEKVNITNIYEYYSQLYDCDELLVNVDYSRELIEDGFIQDQDRLTSNGARYYDQQGRYKFYKRWNENGELQFVDVFDNSRELVEKRQYYKNVLKRIQYFLPGIKEVKQELYYTDSGSCFLNIDYFKESKKVKLISLLDYNTNRVKVFSGTDPLKLWHSYWIEELCYNSYNIKSEKPIIINDDILLTYTMIQVKDDVAIKIQTIHNNHLDDPYILGAKVRKSHQHLMNNIKNFDEVVVLTNEQRKMIEKQFEHNNNISVIPNSTNMIEKYSGTKNYNVISMIGRYAHQKAMHRAIEAFKLVVKDYPDAKLNIFGNGPLKEELQEQINSLKVNNSVFLHDYASDLTEIYGSSLATLLTSVYEGFGLVILESMYQKTPVISFDINFGPKDIITNNEDGWLIEKNNVNALAKQIKKVLKNPQLAIDAGEKAQIKVQSDFNPSITINKWIKLINEIS